MSESAGHFSRTDWSARSVSDMWLALYDQHPKRYWDMVEAWRRTTTLTLDHISVVKNYRDNLATAWPPEKSAAAASYVARLNQLLDHLQDTYDAAVVNHRTLQAATLALTTARDRLEVVVNEYVANEQMLSAFEQRMSALPNGAKKWVDTPKPSPVADGRQAELETQAREIMGGVSAELTQARGQLAMPITYKPTPRLGLDGDADADPQLVAPPIPHITPFDPGAKATHGSISAVSPSPITTADTSASPGAVRQPGLILGGAQPTAMAPPSAPIASGPPSAPISSVTSQPILGTPIVPQTNMPRTPLGQNSFSPGGVPGKSGFPARSLRVVPNSGVIGGNPGMGLSQPGGMRGSTSGYPTAGGRPTTRVNPVGGMINPSGANGPLSSQARPSAASSPFASPTSRTGSRADDSSETSRRDPDNPWFTAEGVAPVVMPVPEQRVDPGPAIGLQ